MIALDTNVVVRVLTNDDPVQVAAAVALLERETTYVPVSVVLETEWVLRSVYGLERETVAGSLRRFLGLPSVTAEAAGRVTQALSWYESGFDFADALHLASASEAGAEGIATFDEDFRRLADGQATALEAIPP